MIIWSGASYTYVRQSLRGGNSFRRLKFGQKNLGLDPWLKDCLRFVGSDPDLSGLNVVELSGPRNRSESETLQY